MSELFRSTINDVARLSGVSIKTVSRVLNGGSQVSEKTKNRVLEAMNACSYQVNLFARGLKGARTNIIMVFVDRHEEEHMSMWHNMILKYLFRYGKEYGLKIMVAPSNSEEYISDETDGFYMLSSGVADGAILLENVQHDPRSQYLREHGIPFLIFGEPDDDSMYAVSLDNYQVGYLGGEYLKSKPFHKVAFLVGEDKFLSTQNRVRGFQDALRGSGVQYDITTHIVSTQQAYEKGRELLGKQKYDAFFVSGDERALGVYRAVYERGCRIPQDVAVLGIDNIPSGEFYYPPISTIEQDFDGMAKTMVQMLCQLIREQTPPEHKQVQFQPSIIEREST